MYTFSLIQNYDQLVDLEQKWRELLDNATFDSVFCCHTWICCWWRTLARPDDIMNVVIAEREGQVVAVAPFMIRRHREYGFHINALRFIGVPNADRCDVIIRTGQEVVVEPLFHYLVSDVHGWNQLHLNEVPKESVFVRWLLENTSLSYVEPGSDCPYVPLSQWENWDEYYAGLSKKTRLELNRKNNRLLKEANGRYFHIESLVASDPEIMRASSVEGLSSKATNRDNLVLNNSKIWKFHQCLLENPKEVKILLSGLDIGGELAAYLYGFVYKKRYYAYNTAYTEQHKDYYSGKLIMNEVLRYTKAKDIDCFEFLRGGTFLKKRWAKDTRIQKNIFWLKKNFFNLVYVMLIFKLRPLIKKYIALFFSNSRN